MIETSHANSLSGRPTMAEIVSGWSATIGREPQVSEVVGSVASVSSGGLQNSAPSGAPTMAELVMGFANSQRPETAVEAKAPFVQAFEMLSALVQQIVTATVSSVLQALGIVQNASSASSTSYPSSSSPALTGQNSLLGQMPISDISGLRDIISLFKEAAPVAKDVLLNLGQGLGGALRSAGSGLGSGIGSVLGGIASVFGLK